MNIAIIGSGGDGAGMNQCLYSLVSRLIKHKIFLFNRGYQGLIDNSISNIGLKELKQQRTKGGIIIKSSRSKDFMTEKGFKKAIQNLSDNEIDLLIVMGGNGSLQGAKKLVQNGINCIFIPTTIDNDIEESDYCIGFDTAVTNAIDFVEKVDTSMQSFDRICIYEVMGRHCEDIANLVTQKTNSSYCYTAKSTKEECLKVIKKELKKEKMPKIILQENVIDNLELKEFLSTNLKKYDIKVAVVGYVQRGGNATKKELEMASCFAKQTVSCIKNKIFNNMICYNLKTLKFESKNI